MFFSCQNLSLVQIIHYSNIFLNVRLCRTTAISLDWTLANKQCINKCEKLYGCANGFRYSGPIGFQSLIASLLPLNGSNSLSKPQCPDWITESSQSFPSSVEYTIPSCPALASALGVHSSVIIDAGGMVGAGTLHSEAEAHAKQMSLRLQL